MREILFRGKTLTGKWFEGAYYKQEEFYGDKEDAHVIITSKDTLDNDFGLLYSVVIPETIGQYTGLTDKNGKKIFEGDIVNYKDARKFSDNDELEEAEEQDLCTDVIKFKNGRFFPLPRRCDCEDYYYSYGSYDFKVIGNIHDNPELLKSEVTDNDR